MQIQTYSDQKIIQMYFNSNHGIHTIARIFSMRSSNVGKIILKYKKKYHIR